MVTSLPKLSSPLQDQEMEYGNEDAAPESWKPQ